MDLGECEMPYKINGKIEMKKYGYALKDLLAVLPVRVLSMRFFLFPFLLNYFIFPKEREMLHNINNLRQKIKDIITEKKRRVIEDESAELQKGDLMTILISDEVFENDVEMIVDECLTFFMAGTQTTSSLVAHTICQAIKNPSIMQNI